MEPWGTLALTGYSCEDFPSRTTRSRLLLRKEEIRPNIWPEIPSDLSLWRRPACQTLSKIYIKCHNSSSPRLVKSPSNSISYNCEKICSWSRRPKTIGVSKSLKDFFNHRKKTSGPVVFSCRPFHYILKYRDHWWNLSTIWKTRLLKTLIEEFS